LKDNYLQYGTYSLSWDGKDKNGNILPAGTYFCVMSANDKRISKRMLFLK
jgi:flagellar hook assembly protein FlgD